MGLLFFVGIANKGTPAALGAQPTVAYYGAAYGVSPHTPPKALPLDSARNWGLEQRKVNAVLGHRSRAAYALTHLAPTKRYQRLA